LKVERESQFNTAGGSEFQVRGAALLKDRLANDVRRKHSLAISITIIIIRDNAIAPLLLLSVLIVTLSCMYHVYS